MNELLWHLEVPRVEGLVVADVALTLGHRDHHAVALLAVHLLRRDGPLQVVFLGVGWEEIGDEEAGSEEGGGRSLTQRCFMSQVLHNLIFSASSYNET